VAVVFSLLKVSKFIVHTHVELVVALNNAMEQWGHSNCDVQRFNFCNG